MAYGMGSHQMYGAGGQLNAEVDNGLPVGARFVGTPRVGVRASQHERHYTLRRTGGEPMKITTTRACSPIRIGVAVMALSLSATAAAQPTGAIDGGVVDANGNPLPGVVVTVTGSGRAAPNT